MTNARCIGGQQHLTSAQHNVSPSRVRRTDYLTRFKTQFVRIVGPERSFHGSNDQRFSREGADVPPVTC